MSNDILFTKVINGPRKDFTYKFQAIVEYDQLSSIYPDDTPEQLKEMQCELARYEAVLFCARVSASFGGIETCEYLGHCHYTDYEEFIKNQDCEDMLDTVTESLINELIELRNNLNKMELI
jgi:hypothetical protein